MIKESNFFHGALITKLLDVKELVIKKHDSFCAYIINGKAFYLKYSKNSISPWSFSFSKEHVDELKILSVQNNNLYIALICNYDGICTLTYNQFQAIIAIDSDRYPKWVKAIRHKREKYSVIASDGKLKYKIGENCLSNALNGV